ncbi:MAG: helix-turn-helix domain-containing protein [Acidobacteria bacterium]|nr:helix-turn-helix domain-containing protein [Acidobacteriota bacterium]
MGIGERIRELREQQRLSQGDIEERTGLLRCYISRVENGHTVPSLETLERFAGALDVPLYRLFCRNNEEPPQNGTASHLTIERLSQQEGAAGEEARFLLKLRELQEHLSPTDRNVILALAKKMAVRTVNPED